MRFFQYTNDEPLYLVTGYCIDITHIIQAKYRNDYSDTFDYYDVSIEEYLQNKENFDKFKVTKGKWGVDQSGVLFIGTCTGCTGLKIGELCCD